MKLEKFISVSSIIALSLGFALPALAQGVSGAIDSTTQGTVNVGTVRGDVGVDVDVEVDTDVKASTSASGSGSGGVRVQAGDVNGDGAAGVAATGTVHGDPDFDLAAKVESTEEHVAVTSKQSAKLFGFIPLTVNATAVVDAEGRVKVKFPWYAIFCTSNKVALESKLEAQTEVIAARERGSGMATGRVATGDVNGDGIEASVKLSADAQARLIAAIQATMESQWRVDTSPPDTN